MAKKAALSEPPQNVLWPCDIYPFGVYQIGEV